MWNDRRLLAAIAALPPEAFIDGTPDQGDLVLKRAIRRLRRELGADTEPEPGHVAPVLPLRTRRTRLNG
jgi:hypothetical protein